MNDSSSKAKNHPIPIIMSTIHVEEVTDEDDPSLHGDVHEATKEQEDPSSPSKRQDLDPLVKIVMNKDLMEISSTLIAKLEHVRYDATRRGVFKTKWGSALFASCIKRLKDGQQSSFDINGWYSDIIAKSRTNTDYDINPALYAQTVDTNWLLPLFEMEMATPGFMTILHNIMDLEDSTHTKLATKAKTETEYDFLNLGARNAATLSIAGPTATTHKYITSKK